MIKNDDEIKLIENDEREIMLRQKTSEKVWFISILVRIFILNGWIFIDGLNVFILVMWLIIFLELLIFPIIIMQYQKKY